MSRADLLLFAVLPYVAIAVFVAGHAWRYRQDQFGWTSRSTQLLERHLLRVGSILFHVGALLAIGGHVLGILVPQSWTEAAGIDEGAYKVISAAGGLIAGFTVVAGLLVLIWRRLRAPRVAATTTGTDVAVYGLLVVAIVSGLAATLLNNFVGFHNYRDTVGPWFRSLLVLDPQPERMAQAPFIFQFHVTAIWFLYMLWPFSRLVHVWSVPVTYFGRAHILYRSRTGHRPAPRPAARVGAAMTRGGISVGNGIDRS